MKYIFWTFLIFNLLSCTNNTRIESQTESQLKYLDNEFNYRINKFSDYNDFLREKWGENYDKAKNIEQQTISIEQDLNKIGNLNKSIYSKIDTFFSICKDEEIEDKLLSINTEQYTEWHNEYKINESLSNLEKLLLLVKIKSIRNNICKEYFDLVERYYYKFSIISFDAKPISTQLKVGDTYKTDISIHTYDDLNKPEFEINGKKIAMKDGIWHLEIPCTKKGEYTWNGIIRMANPLLLPTPYKVSGKYSVK